jgi:hypothetical protein
MQGNKAWIYCVGHAYPDNECRETTPGYTVLAMHTQTTNAGKQRLDILCWPCIPRQRMQGNNAWIYCVGHAYPDNECRETTPGYTALAMHTKTLNAGKQSLILLHGYYSEGLDWHHFWKSWLLQCNADWLDILLAVNLVVPVSNVSKHTLINACNHTVWCQCYLPLFPCSGRLPLLGFHVFLLDILVNAATVSLQSMQIIKAL